MHRLLRVLCLTLALALVALGCGEDTNDPAPIDEAEPGEVTDAGVEGAFGEIDDCAALADEAAAAYQRVVDELGDANRNQVNRIDAALESFGGIGPDLQVRADGLDCGRDALDAAICEAIGTLEAGGRAAEDFIDGVSGGCAKP